MKYIELHYMLCQRNSPQDSLGHWQYRQITMGEVCGCLSFKGVIPSNGDPPREANKTK